MSKEPPAQKVSDEDLIKAVRDECELSIEPMVKTKTIAERDDITINQNSVANRLGNLTEDGHLHSVKVGRGYVWSVADAEDIEGPVDYNQINWDAIPAEKIPEEKLHQHPDFPVLDTWRTIHNHSQTLLTFGLGALAVGFLAFGFRDLSLFTGHSETFNIVGALMIIAGGTGAFFGFIVFGIARLGPILEKRGVIDAGRDVWNRVKARVEEGIPVSIEIEWKR